MDNRKDYSFETWPSSEESVILESYLTRQGMEKQECPKCGKESYTGLHLCKQPASDPSLDKTDFGFNDKEVKI